ncbi:MAG: DUF1801 domain-containing protein [Armatimonadetes bacterium]|nr:DUF1801 domain-containing protein [Armatimonadota bacterium]
MIDAPSPIDGYLDTLPSDKRRTLQHLRATVSELVPEVTEGISYQLPAFRWQGRLLVCFGAAKHHCALYPMSRAVIKSLADDLAGYSTSEGTIRFPPDEPLPEELVEKVITLRLAELADKKPKS